MANNDKYKQYSREELIDELETLKKKKYGLVWDKKNSQEMLDAFVNWENVPENFVPKQFPVLKEVKNKEIETDKAKPVNLLIEGDNYHSLAVLNFTHQSKVDVIYIDPPYNTGNKDFIYNDQIINREDPFRHSKWLSFMEKRLNLSKYLLKNTGVIFISIDDNEQAQLKLLCDEVFGEENFIANLVWENKEGGGSSDSKHFKIKHEYVVVYAKDKNKLTLSREEITDEDAYTYSDEYEKERGRHKLIKLNSASIQYSKSLDYPIIAPDKSEICPSYGKKKACWRWSKEKFEWGVKNDFIKISKDKKGNWVVYSKQYLNVDNENNPIERQRAPLGVIPFFSSTMATKQLESIFHKKVFDYSKPYLLIQYLLKLSTGGNSIVLDFMAGSGTTGQAVLELNKEDKGSRKFILCTNNENNICTEVCYPRIEKIINGYKNSKDNKIVGLGGNLKYFKTDFVGSDSTDKNKRDLVNKSAEMICIKEDIFDLVIDKGQDFKIYQKGKKLLGVIFDIDAIADFKKEAEKHKGNFVVYCFSYNEATPEKEFKNLKNKYVVKPIPAVILRIYLEIFKK